MPRARESWLLAWYVGPGSFHNVTIAIDRERIPIVAHRLEPVRVRKDVFDELRNLEPGCWRDRPPVFKADKPGRGPLQRVPRWDVEEPPADIPHEPAGPLQRVAEPAQEPPFTPVEELHGPRQLIGLPRLPPAPDLLEDLKGPRQLVAPPPVLHPRSGPEPGPLGPLQHVQLPPPEPDELGNEELSPMGQVQYIGAQNPHSEEVTVGGYQNFIINAIPAEVLTLPDAVCSYLVGVEPNWWEPVNGWSPPPANPSTGSVVKVYAAYSQQYQNLLIIGDPTSTSSFAIALLDAVAYGGQQTTFKHPGTAHTVTLTPVAGQTIDGQSTYVLAAGQAVTLVSDGGTNWRVTYSTAGGGIAQSTLGQPGGPAQLGSDGYVGGATGSPLTPSVANVSSDYAGGLVPAGARYGSRAVPPAVAHVLSPGLTIGALTSTLSTGGPITSLPLTLTADVLAGDQISIVSGASGATVQNFTVTTAASAGATSVAISSATPISAFTSAAMVALDIGVRIQKALDGTTSPGAPIITIHGDGFHNTPVFDDTTAGIVNGKSQDRHVQILRTGTIVYGAGLPTTSGFLDPTTKFAYFPNTLRTAWNKTTNIVQTDDTTAVNGTTESCQSRLTLSRGAADDGGGDNTFTGAQNLGLVFGNQSSGKLDHLSLRGMKFGLGWRGYSDGSEANGVTVHNSRGAQNLGSTVSCGALNAPLSTGGPITSLPVTLTKPVEIYQPITVTDGGSNTQTFIAAAGAESGATSLTITSATPNFAYSSAAACSTLLIPFGWIVYQQTNGDNVTIRKCQVSGTFGIWNATQACGGYADGGIQGAYVFNNCQGIVLDSGRFELSDSSAMAPSVIVNCSQVKLTGQDWHRSPYAGGYFLKIRDDPTSPSAGSSVDLDALHPRTYLPGISDPGVAADIFIQSINDSSTLRVRNAAPSMPAASGVFDYASSLIVKSAVSAVTTALNLTSTYSNWQRAILASSEWELVKTTTPSGNTWVVRGPGPVGSMQWISANGTPAFTTSPGDGGASFPGALTNGQLYEYTMAVLDDATRFSHFAAAQSATANANGSLAWTANVVAQPCNLVVWRKAGTGVTTAPDAYALIPMDRARIAIFDQGTHVNGIPWVTTSVPVANTSFSYNSTVDSLSAYGNGISIIFSNGAPNTTAAPAAVGSLYVRKDGTADDQLFINASGSPTGWKLVGAGVTKVLTSGQYPYTTSVDDGFLGSDAAGAARAITLTAPAAASDHVTYIQKVDSSANTVTVTPSSGTINGSATDVLSTQNQCHGYKWDGARFNIVSKA